jgi:hypothetical protein
MEYERPEIVWWIYLTVAVQEARFLFGVADAGCGVARRIFKLDWLLAGGG